MIKVLQIFSVVALLFAGMIYGLCAMEYLDIEPEKELDAELSLVEKFKQAGQPSGKIEKKVSSALVQQAEAFALYLKRPAPPKFVPRPSPLVKKQVATKKLEIKPVALSPKFELHGISYYRSKPEESMALVWEPGSGYRWIKQGEKLGHFTVDQVKSASITYRDGQRTHEMVFVPSQTTTRVARDHNDEPATEQSNQPEGKNQGRPPREGYIERHQPVFRRRIHPVSQNSQKLKAHCGPDISSRFVLPNSG